MQITLLRVSQEHARESLLLEIIPTKSTEELNFKRIRILSVVFKNLDCIKNYTSVYMCSKRNPYLAVKTPR